MSIRFLFYTLLVLQLTLIGCTNWELKEKCRDTNWFNYSQELAFQGKYLEEDAFVKQCKDIDISNAQQLDIGFKLGREKMCRYDEIFVRGKSGEPVFFKFCDGLELSKMKSSHLAGLKEFCVSDVAYNYGKSGKIYQKVCSAEQEKLFLPKYYAGRKEFLESRIIIVTDEVKNYKEKYADSVSREHTLSQEYASIPRPQDCSYKSVYNEATKQDEQKYICTESSYTKFQRERIFDQLSELRKTIRDAYRTILALENDLVNYKDELEKINNI